MPQYELKATKVDLLDYIESKELVGIYDLVKDFGYTYDAARCALWRLGRQRLAVRLARGSWTLTDLGRDGLNYLKKKGV